MQQKAGGFWDDVVARVDPGKCRRCVDCPPVARCPSQSLRRSDINGLPTVDPGFCLGCYACVEVCAYGAISPPKRRQASEREDLRSS